MRPNEVWEALENERPVIFSDAYIGELEYQKVSAVITRKGKDGKLYHSVELTVGKGCGVVIVDPKNIRYK